MSTKERIDVLLVRNGYFDSREKAQAAIMAGLILVGTERIEKPGTKIDVSLELTVKGAVHPYVSRGGLKLEKALREFDIDITNRTVIDIGASTGGFTDCALQHGAKSVYAVDVGYNQLDWSLRSHPQVHVLERTNVRYLQKQHLTSDLPEIAVIDVSFISLKLILPILPELLVGPRQVIALIKPQFEAGREQVGKHGVVRDDKVHMQVINDVVQFSRALGFELRGLSFSPITGGEGNIEFLACWSIDNQADEQIQVDCDLLYPNLIQAVVSEAHQRLRGTI
jgi:23S rRNA (cytidine1920-2'-O)/16S rRNA (cytidine1409-2'-O)-methyltransferase